MMCPTVIDLFSGCGGFSTGMLDAGLAVKAGFDFDAPCIEVYNYNHTYRGAKGYKVDLAGATGDSLLELAGLKSVDVVVGGPPCQAFSIVGARGGLEDSRGALIFDYVRLVGELRPKAFILENVPNLRTFEGGAVYERLVQDLADLGYDVAGSILAAADYGVAQMRKRLFIVGLRGRRVSGFPPAPTHGKVEGSQLALGLAPYRTTEAVLRDLPDVDAPEAEHIPNHEPTMHTEPMLRLFADLQPGQRCRASFHDRLHPDRLAYTLRAGSGNFSPLRPIHYRHDRVISVRESARIQGFDDAFIWPDSIPRLQQYRQVGNAVCPPMAHALGLMLCEQMGWRADPKAFAGDPKSRPPPCERTLAERLAIRQKYMHGASQGWDKLGRKQAVSAKARST